MEGLRRGLNGFPGWISSLHLFPSYQQEVSNLVSGIYNWSLVFIFQQLVLVFSSSFFVFQSLSFFHWKLERISSWLDLTTHQWLPTYLSSSSRTLLRIKSRARCFYIEELVEHIYHSASLSTLWTFGSSNPTRLPCRSWRIKKVACILWIPLSFSSVISSSFNWSP